MGESFPSQICIPNLIAERAIHPSLTVNKFRNVKEIIRMVRKLVGSTVYERLESSFIGPTLKAIARDLHLSEQLLHCVFTRSLVTEKENELWFHFGGNPMKFSIREFHLVTGLNCIGDEEILKDEMKVKWSDLEGNKHTLAQLLNHLKNSDSASEDERFSLTLVLMVEHLYLYKTSNRYFDRDHIKLAKDKRKVEEYPWGKKAYKILLESVRYTINNSLGKEKYEIDGFPLALQMWIVASIPVLQTSFSRIDKNCNGYICERFLEFMAPSLDQIISCETDDVKVIMILEPSGNNVEDSICLEDKVDEKLQSMIDLVSQGYRIRMEEWRRGFVEYVDFTDALATQKCIQPFVEKVEEEEEEEEEVEEEVVPGFNIVTMFYFMKDQFESLAERMSSIEDQMKILNENVVDLRNCHERKKEETEQKQSKTYEHNENNCFENVEQDKNFLDYDSQETEILDDIETNNSSISKTVELNLENEIVNPKTTLEDIESVNPNTIREDIEELKKNEFGESVETKEKVLGPSPTFDLNITPSESQADKKKKHEDYERDDDLKRRKLIKSEKTSSEGSGIGETVYDKSDKLVTNSVKAILSKLVRTVDNSKLVKPQKSIQKSENSMTKRRDIEMQHYDEWKNRGKQSAVLICGKEVGLDWFISFEEESLNEEHIDAVIKTLNSKMEIDSEQKNLTKVAFLTTNFLKKMMQVYRSPKFTKNPMRYIWSDDIIQDAQCDQWMKGIEVLYGAVQVKNNENWFGMCINLKKKIITIFDAEDIDKQYVQPFAELFGAFLFAMGKTTSYMPLNVEMINRQYCAKTRLSTNKTFSMMKHMECHSMGIEDVSELNDKTAVYFRKKMASEIFYFFEYC